MEAFWYIISFGIVHALVAMRVRISIVDDDTRTHHAGAQVAAIWGRPRWIVILLVVLWLTYFCTTFGVCATGLRGQAILTVYSRFF